MLQRSILGAMLGATLVACNMGLYQGPDRPDDSPGIGPPPPADFHCERGERRRAVTAGTAHVVHVLANGEVICSSDDTNSDGKIDTWNRLENGRVVEQAVDTDFDGSLDRRVLSSPGLVRPVGSVVPPVFFAPLPSMQDGGH